MIMFWIFVVAMVIIALVFLIRPLRKDFSENDVDREEQNIDIAKERLNELKAELEQGIINQTEYDQTRGELEQSLLTDIEQPTGNTNKKTNQFPNHITQLVLIFVIPIFSISLYFYLGQPDLINASKKQAATPAGHTSKNGGSGAGSMEEMIEKLAARMKQEPDNAEGWFMLGRSYMSLNRYKDAVDALEKTNQLVPNNPTVMLRYADALTMLSGGKISGKPFQLIKQAVEIKPDDPTGLWLLGMGYDEQGEYAKAISYWSLLLPLLKDEKSIMEVKTLMQRARRMTGEAISESPKPKILSKKESSENYIKVNVSVDKNILKNVSADDIVYIFAKALTGPPMPLAVARKKVKDLPVQVVLDDSMAMTPTMKLSNFKQVQVVARISKSGSAKPQAGDFQSDTRIVSTSKRENIEIKINKLIP